MEDVPNYCNALVSKCCMSLHLYSIDENLLIMSYLPAREAKKCNTSEKPCGYTM